MKLLYRPFGIIAGLIGARIARKLFQAIWARIDEHDPPKASTEDTTLPKVIGAAAIEAATTAATRAAVERASLKCFQFLTGIWAGEKHQSETEK
jgi:xanthosine utilization system XapX-like protein